MHGDDGAIHSRFGFGDRELQARGGQGALIRHSFSFPGRMNSRFFASTKGRDQPEISRVSEWPIARPAMIMSRSEEHTSELQSLMRNSYAVFCLKKKNRSKTTTTEHQSRLPIQ